jgi:hypothetical protein
VQTIVRANRYNTAVCNSIEWHIVDVSNKLHVSEA